MNSEKTLELCPGPSLTFAERMAVLRALQKMFGVDITVGDLAVVSSWMARAWAQRVIARIAAKTQGDKHVFQV